MLKLYTPISEETIRSLKVNDRIEIHGIIFAGRDAVLPRLVEVYKKGLLVEYGVDLTGSVIFHTAVSPAGIGPTSSNKLDIESSIPDLSAAGVKIHLGKGALDAKTVEALKLHNSIFAVTPPVSALLTSRVKSAGIAAFPEEGMEALYRLEMAGIPAIVAIAHGKSIFDY